MRIPGITDEDAGKALTSASSAEGLKVSADIMTRIVRECNGNLRKGLLLLEACAASYVIRILSVVDQILEEHLRPLTGNITRFLPRLLRSKLRPVSLLFAPLSTIFCLTASQQVL
jgi:hypothetical protein